MTTSHVRSGRRPNAWWVGTIAGMASYIDAAAIVSSGIALVLYQHSIGLTEGQIGILSALLTVGIATGAILGGRLGDRFGRRRIFLLTMLLIAIGAGLLALTQGFALLAIGTAMVGLGAGGDLPVSLATISEAADDHNRGKLIGFSQILWTLGILVVMGMSTIVGGWGQLVSRVIS